MTIANISLPAAPGGPTMPNAVVRLGPFVLDPEGFALHRDGELVRLERRPMELLLILAASPGRLVTRDQIAQRLWGEHIHVEIDMGIHTAIRKLRRALGDYQRHVETVPGKGYRLRLYGEPPATVATDPIPRRVIAVLPFNIISASQGYAYIAAGLTEEIIVSLGQIDPERLAVIGFMSVVAMRGTSDSLAAIGQTLGADLLLDGSLQVEGRRLRATCKLIDVATQCQIWAASLNAEPLSMLEFHRELAAAISAQIHLRLSDESARALARRQTGNPEAYDLYLRGRHLLNQFTQATNKRAIEYFQQATAADPGYALAWAGIAETLAASLVNGDVPHDAVAARARDAASRALDAEPQLAEALSGAGFVQLFLDWRWRAAEQSFRAAGKADPNYANAHRMVGIVLTHLGQHAEAREALARARALEPWFAQMHALSAFAAFAARDYTAAIDHARQAIVVEPSFWIGHFQLAQACAEDGQIERALQTLGALRRAPACNSKVLSLQGYVLAMAGRETEARAVLATLSDMATTSFVPPYAAALIHAGLDDADAAFAALNAAFEVHDVHLIFVPIDPKWDRLRSDKRMAELLKRCDFLEDKRPASRLRVVG